MKKSILVAVGLLGLCVAGPINAQQSRTVLKDFGRLTRAAAPAQHVRLSTPVDVAEVGPFLRRQFAASDRDELRLERTSIDGMGMQHLRFQQYRDGYPVFGAVVKAHARGGKVEAVSGHFLHDLPAAQVLVDAHSALATARTVSGAGMLITEVPGQEAYLAQVTGKPASAWMPNGRLIYVPNMLGDAADSYRLAWEFDIYSVEPLFRAHIYVDAVTGEVIFRNDRLHTADANGLGHTKFSGVRSIVVDSTGNGYRLREEGRALGVETYDMLNQTDYQSAVDITQGDSEFDSLGSITKKAGLDAHWGAEMTYDYFMANFGRDSYDEQGSKLISYVHFDNGYSNAFWNGQFMTYGDGGGNNNPFSGLDVCGHEFTHGVTEYAAGLVYAYEPGALNESFSDIFGNAIERVARPNDYSWGIGDDIGAFRSMANPKVFFNPDTYLGDFWNSGGSDNGGVHTNSGVQNHWFYLLTEGGSGVNDNGDSYSVSGLGLDTASQIAYRNLQVYLTPNDGYAEARYFAIQSAIDLYGECSNAMIQTMNAWHAVGVGGPFTGTLAADFYSPDTNSCQMPAQVQFYNRSTSGLNFLWNFGDGNTSIDENPLHIYTAAGDYTVTLIAFGCNGATDTIVFPNRIHIDPQMACTVNMPASGDSLVQTGCEGNIYDSGGSDDYLPNSNSRVTINPVGNAQVNLVFSTFNYAAGDRLTIFDGPNSTYPQLGVFAGTTIPGPFLSTNGALTLIESTNGANNREGFQASWSCITVGVEDPSASQCTLSPNPTNGWVKLNWNRIGHEAHSIAVHDALGRLVWQQVGEHDGLWEQELDFSSLTPGIYMVQTTAGEDQVAQKIIVQ